MVLPSSVALRVDVAKMGSNFLEPESCAISRRKKRKLKVIMHPEELLLLHTQVQNV